MLLYLADAAALIAETLGGIVATQLLNEGARVARYVARKFDGIDALQDNVVRAHRIGAGKRWRACVGNKCKVNFLLGVWGSIAYP